MGSFIQDYRHLVPIILGIRWEIIHFEHKILANINLFDVCVKEFYANASYFLGKCENISAII